jgi:dienelactone hydrolase
MSRPSLVLFGLALSLIAAGPLSDTKPWAMPADPAREMVEGLHRFLDHETVASAAHRAERRAKELASVDTYRASVGPRRRRLAEILGATGERVNPVRLEYVGGPDVTIPLVANESIRVTAVRWTVYPGFDAEGLLVEPRGPIKASVVAIPDADTSPEQLAGIAPGLKEESQVARLLAGRGCQVLIPTLIDRTTEFSGSPLVRFTNLSHREWIYRMAYEAGRHVIGYEVDEVRAAVDWFTRPGEPKRPIGVVGQGEGGLIALYAAALDTRIEAVRVAGYFGSREQVWSEPIDRNIWGLLEDFGDHDVAMLLLGRGLDVEFSAGPEVKGPPPAKNGRSDAASGRLHSSEADRRDAFTKFHRFMTDVSRRFPAEIKNWNATIPGAEHPRSDLSGKSFVATLGLEQGVLDLRPIAVEPRPATAARQRMGRLVKGLEAYTQSSLRTSELRRNAYWSKADRSTVAAWETSTEPYRAAFWTDILGKFPPASEPMAVESKPVYDEPRWTGYAIKIPVWPDVFASGVLLVPKDLKPGERRPVVVCQHGLEGTPEPVVDPRIKSVYNSYGAQLADRGYIVYAPQNPYIGNDRFRQLQRKANPLGKSLFGLIVRQHERTLEWLKTRPEVDPKRIAFYGLSYGGKSAMRLPAILKDYCLSICSADFNEWVVKCTNLDRQYSYLFTIEYDMYEFGLAERFNYAEMAALIAPRPFMVERGHDDGVAPDEWIGYEFAKVKRTYDRLGIGDRAELAVFNGGHKIDGKDSFKFLARHLNWPRGAVAP